MLFRKNYVNINFFINVFNFIQPWTYLALFSDFSFSSRDICVIIKVGQILFGHGESEVVFAENILKPGI